MKKVKQFISFALVLSFFVTQTNISAFAEENPSIYMAEETTNVDYIEINGEKYSAEEFAEYLSHFDPEDYRAEASPNSVIAGVAAVFLIPGIGEVALLVSGAVLVGVTIYHVNNPTYHTAVDWIYNSKSKSRTEKAKDAADSLPNKLKLDDKHVDLDDFVDKNGNTPRDQNSGTFRSRKDGRYTIDKDTSNHTGYDGTIKKWKIKKNGKKVGSLNGEGKVISD